MSEKTFKKFPKCKGCKYFKVDTDPSSDHYGIPDTCEDTNRESWEENPEQESFFICNPVQEWRGITAQKLREIKKQLNEILDSELMKQAEKFMGKRVRDRWEGQLSVVEELLEALEK